MYLANCHADTFEGKLDKHRLVKTLKNRMPGKMDSGSDLKLILQPFLGSMKVGSQAQPDFNSIVSNGSVVSPNPHAMNFQE